MLFLSSIRNTLYTIPNWICLTVVTCRNEVGSHSSKNKRTKPKFSHSTHPKDTRTTSTNTFYTFYTIAGKLV